MSERTDLEPMEATAAVLKGIETGEFEVVRATEIARLRAENEALRWLSTQQGTALVSDDDGRWAVTSSGVQPVVEGEHDGEFVGMYDVQPEQWRPTIMEAIEAERAALESLDEAEARDDAGRL